MSKINLTSKYADTEGIDIQYNRKSKTLTIEGWYESDSSNRIFGMEPIEISLEDLLRKLKIPKKSIMEACEQIKSPKKENKIEKNENFMDIPTEFANQAKEMIDKYGKNVYISKNNEIGEILYSVTVSGTSFWLHSFDTLKEACEYCDKWELIYDKTEAEMQAENFDKTIGYWS